MSWIEDIRNNETIDIRSLIFKYWEKKLTIIFVLLLVALIEVKYAYHNNFKEVVSQISFVEWIFIGFTLAIIFTIWVVSRRPQSTASNKIGIIIAISCEDKRERQRLKADLVNSLKSEIAKGNTRKFQIVELSEYHANRISSQETAKKYHKVTHGHLILYGSCRIRSHQGAEHYVISLNASVTHRPVPSNVSTELGQEMRSLIPPQRLFPVSDELNGFNITRELLGIASRYIVGIASLISGDIETSFDLHAGLWNEIKHEIEREGNIPAEYLYIRSKLPPRLVIEGLTLTSHVYTRKSPDYLEQMNKYLTIVQEVDPRNYSAHMFRGIYHFFYDRNIAKAKEEIRKSRNERDAAWQYSDAFLAAYDGDLEQAHRLYQRAFRGNVRDSMPLEVETFINDVLNQEPDKIQLWYCLGMINYFGKGDIQLASKDFKKFVECANQTQQFRTSVEFAHKYLNEMEESN